MDKSNVAFSELHATCDKLAVELRLAGIGAKVNHAAVVTPEEDQLWNLVQLAFSTPSIIALCVLLCWQMLLLTWRSGNEGAKTIAVCQGLKSRQLHLCRKWIQKSQGHIWQ